MEEVLGVWRALLLPLTSDPEVPAQMKALRSSVKGTRITADMLKVRVRELGVGLGSVKGEISLKFVFLPAGDSFRSSSAVSL